MQRDFQRPLVAMAAIVLLSLSTGSVIGQSWSNSSATELVRSANERAEVRYRQASQHWKHKLSVAGSEQRFRQMARDIIAFDEKVTQGFELFEGKSTTRDRMRASFRKRILDERRLIQEMEASFVDLQRGLIQESVQLYIGAGVQRSLANSAFRTYGVDTKPWQAAFDPLLTKAKTLSEQDWIRAAGVQVGSYYGGDGLADAARSSGLWAPKKNSWLDLATQVVADMVVEEALEQVTDPSQEFAARLRKHYVAAQQELLEGKQGLLTAMRRITDLHQQTRNKHFALVKGGR